MRTLLCFTLGVALAACMGDIGPIKKDNQPTYKDFARFQRDIELLCFSAQLSGSDSIVSTSDRATAVATWLSTQYLGEDVKKIMDVIESVPPADKANILLVEASQANVVRCPLAEQSFPGVSAEFREACNTGNVAVCRELDEAVASQEQIINLMIEDTKAECAKGRSAHCAMPAQYEQMRLDLRAGRPLPQPPLRLRLRSHLRRMTGGFIDLI